MPQRFDSIYIIYNPKSTGSSKQRATKLAKTLKKETLYKVHVVPTKKAKHAVSIAKRICKSHKYPLIISVSGDGGYHEVINGVLAASNSKKSTATCAILPAGNANDHASVLQIDSIVDLIKSHSIKYNDVLSVTIAEKAKKNLLFAHSYVGIGLTAEAGHAINKQATGYLSSVVTASKTVARRPRVSIEHDGQEFRVVSLTCMNIPRMAKHFKVNRDITIDDGEFEVVIVDSNRLHILLRKLWHAASKGLEPEKTVKSYSFRVLEDCLLQCDGEIVELTAQARVNIESKNKILKVLR